MDLQPPNDDAKPATPGASPSVPPSSTPPNSGDTTIVVGGSPGRFTPGQILGNRYRIVALLGRGGMGEVYRAEDLSLHQPVALKFLQREARRDPAFMQRIRDEVRLARQVSHPNVCRVHDIGESDGQLFLSMEYIDGEDLAVLLRRIGRLPEEKALEIARQVCAGLAAAHAAGVLHRDLKPANVMLDREGRAHITDFGIAVAGKSTEVLDLAGTPAYMAPEQLAGLGASVRSDLFALGLVLYELVTGKRLFAGRSLAELSQEQREIVPVPPSRLAPDIHPQVEKVILQCLARDPDRRPATALAVLTALSGGDPLGAALAAGQTPSPQMVAAAPATGALRPAVAWACAASVLVSLVVYFALGGRFSVTERARLRLPPAALAEKAREAMRDLGLDGPWMGESYAYDYDDDALRFVGSATREMVESEAFGRAEEQLIVFWYRCSPDLLVPRDPTGSVSRDDPPLGAGDALVVLDSAGRLLSFAAVPAPDADARAREPESTALLRLAGFDATRVERVAPRGARTPVEDARQAWRCPVAGRPGLEMTAEVAFRSGRPVSFLVLSPWTTSVPAAVEPHRFFAASDVPDLFIVTMLVAAIPLARYNLRRGRGDRRGAKRLATMVLVCDVMYLVLVTHHVPVFEAERARLLHGVAWGLYLGGTTWLLYVALEPWVRRLWPERLVSWARLLAGNVRDPMVARDVLVGTTVVFGLAAVTSLLIVLLRASPLLVVKRELAPLLGTSGCFASTAVALLSAVRLGLLCLLLLLLLRLIGRFRHLAPITLGVVLAAVTYTAVFGTLGSDQPTALVMSALSGATIVLLLGRFGLVAAATALFLENLSVWLPDATRLTGWYAHCSWWVLGVAAILTTYGLYFATGCRPLGGRSLIEDY